MSVLGGRNRRITGTSAFKMTDGSYVNFPGDSLKRHQAIYNNAVHTPATPIASVHQIM
jgi:hypothetical protein